MSSVAVEAVQALIATGLLAETVVEHPLRLLEVAQVVLP